MKKINRLDLLVTLNVLLSFALMVVFIIFTLKCSVTHTKTFYLCKFKPYVNYTDTVINFIKESEGLILTPTRCPANKLSIGYGHIILKNEKFKKITKTEANCLLEYDFEKCYCLTSENLNHYQKLAMAHFIYSVGINNYKKIKRKIRKGEYIGNELLKYVYYKDKKGNNIFSTNAKKGRLFELKMFYNR